MESNWLAVDKLEKDLGILITWDINASKQWLYAFNKATRLMGMIKKTINN